MGSTEARVERIVGEELERLNWSQEELEPGGTGETAQGRCGQAEGGGTAAAGDDTLRQIAERLHLGSWKSLNNKLYLRNKRKEKRK